MERHGKRHRQRPRDGLVIVYARLDVADYEELKRREEETGAPISAQLRLLVRRVLRQRTVIR